MCCKLKCFSEPDTLKAEIDLISIDSIMYLCIYRILICNNLYALLYSTFSFNKYIFDDSWEPILQFWFFFTKNSFLFILIAILKGCIEESSLSVYLTLCYSSSITGISSTFFSNLCLILYFPLGCLSSGMSVVNKFPPKETDKPEFTVQTKL